jgi:hypothetical protein
MRRSFLSSALQAARAADRAARQQQRDKLRQTRALERDMRLMQREEKRRYQEDRAAKVAALNDELNQSLLALDSILRSGLKRDPSVDWFTLSQPPMKSSDFNASLTLPIVPRLESMCRVAPGLLDQLIPGGKARHQRRVMEAKEKHAELVRVHGAISQHLTAALGRRKKVSAHWASFCAMTWMFVDVGSNATA